MFKWKSEHVFQNLYGYFYKDDPEFEKEESVLVQFDVKHSFEVLEKFSFCWGTDSSPSVYVMQHKAKKWSEKIDAQLIMIAHDALRFTCRRLTEEEAAEIFAEANSMKAEVINCNYEVNKNLTGQNGFTLWWD